MLGLRQKLTFAFGGMLVILTTVGTLSGLLLTKYSATLEKLFRENYDSVVYGQNMKDAIDELDDMAQATLWGNQAATDAPAFTTVARRFEGDFAKEKSNITVHGEDRVAAELELTWIAYRERQVQLLALSEPTVDRRSLYRNELAPRAQRIKALSQQIIDLNLANIVSVDGQVRESARVARNAMVALVVSGIVLAILLTAILGRAIIRPLATLTQSVREVEKGNLDLTVDVTSQDEIGQLAEAFNSMASRLREYRRSDRAKLIRVQRTTQLALNTFPDAVAIVGLDGKVELANEAAQRRFDMMPGHDLATGKVKAIWRLFEQVFATLAPAHPSGYDTAIQVFDAGRERFFLPQAVPIISEDKSLVGVTIVLADVTDLRRLDEMKSGLLSVVSHELKTPLTSIRMSTHLLLDERLGPLTEKQGDLLVTARDDAERLNAIIDKLLDMGRIESGRALMDLKPTAPDDIVTAASEAALSAYRERGVTLKSEVEEDLPLVLADASRIGHVFSNLLSNALKYTPSGGVVTLSARRDQEGVAFVVADSGSGISEESLPRIFERFFRAPDQGDVKGVGLGLAIAREIVEAHGGLIEAASKIGAGSVFTVKLRASEAIDHNRVKKGESHG